MSAYDDEAFECPEGDVGGCLCIADACQDECVVCWPIEVSEEQELLFDTAEEESVD